MEGKMGPGNKTIAGTCVVWFLLSQKYTTRECHPLNLVEIALFSVHHSYISLLAVQSMCCSYCKQ